jgi:hypothetical protein
VAVTRPDAVTLYGIDRFQNNIVSFTFPTTPISASQSWPMYR